MQTIGHCMLDFQTLPVHLDTGYAHKFHGPKGLCLQLNWSKEKMHLQKGAPMFDAFGKTVGLILRLTESLVFRESYLSGFWILCFEV